VREKKERDGRAYACDIYSSMALTRAQIATSYTCTYATACSLDAISMRPGDNARINTFNVRMDNMFAFVHGGKSRPSLPRSEKSHAARMSCSQNTICSGLQLELQLRPIILPEKINY
jgi:hypothetical protein